MKLKDIIIIFGVSLWPVNLYFANTTQDFISYLIPALLILLCYILYKRNYTYYYLPIVTVGIFEQKLSLLPVIFLILELTSKISKVKLFSLLLTLVVMLFQFQGFKGQTILYRDYQMEQEVIRNTYLYPSIPMARVFQNKLRIYLNKFSFNLFALTDPNNYFFGFHPRQITVTNQNIYKYPFIAIVFVLYGIFFIKNSSDKKFLLISFVSVLTNLSLLQNFDRNDFILWVPISILFVYGVQTMYKNNKKLWNIISIMFLVFSIPQFLRSYVEKIL